MQSGISASAQLQSAFQVLKSSPTQRGLIATITNESIVPSETITSSSSDFYSDLSNLVSHLKPNEALYILLKLKLDSSTTPNLVAVTYVPNAAPVRQKTLFASTRLTLVRELGSDHFAESIFATEADELSAEGWRRHEGHTAAERPLTEEERNLVDIKEAEALESQGTAARKGHVQKSVAIRIGDGVGEALKALAEGGSKNLVQLNMDLPTETVRLDSVTSASPSDLATLISSATPRFSFYRHSTSSESHIVFIYTCPTSTPVKERMLYALERNMMVVWAEQEAGLSIAKKLEATNPDEISASTIEDEFAPKEETKRAFAKPKRPGRR